MFQSQANSIKLLISVPQLFPCPGYEYLFAFPWPWAPAQFRAARPCLRLSAIHTAAKLLWQTLFNITMMHSR